MMTNIVVRVILNTKYVHCKRIRIKRVGTGTLKLRSYIPTRFGRQKFRSTFDNNREI